MMMCFKLRQSPCLLAACATWLQSDGAAAEPALVCWLSQACLLLPACLFV
jgi:hypothetical protein